MTVTTRNCFELSDFSVDIYETGDSIKVRVDCFADDSVQFPFNVYGIAKISNEITNDRKLFYHTLSVTVARLINGIINSDVTPPDKCECQNHDWFKSHPEDRQAYWRTKAGRIYSQAHTVKCPNNPSNRKKDYND